MTEKMQITGASLDQSVSHGRGYTGGLKITLLPIVSKKNVTLIEPITLLNLIDSICTEFSLKRSNQIKLKHTKKYLWLQPITLLILINSLCTEFSLDIQIRLNCVKNWISLACLHLITNLFLLFLRFISRKANFKLRFP